MNSLPASDGLPAYRGVQPPDAGFPAVTTAAFPLTATQMNRVFRADNAVMMIVAAAYAAAFLMLPAWISTYAADKQTLFTAWIYFIVSVAVLAIWTIRHRHRFDTARYAAARCKGDVTAGKIEIFADRAVKTTAVGQTVLRFADVDTLHETSDLLWIRQDDQIIGWRAADLTPEQADMVRRLVYSRVPPAKRVYRGTLTGGRDAVCPLPEKPPMPDHTEMTYRPRRASPYRRAAEHTRRWIVPLGSATLAAAVLVAEMNFLTDIYFLDVFAYFILLLAGAAALFWLLSWLCYRPTPHDRPAQIAVTATGVIILRGASTVSFQKGDIAWAYGDDGLTLSVPHETFVVPWSDMADREAVTGFLPTQRHTGSVSITLFEEL